MSESIDMGAPISESLEDFFGAANSEKVSLNFEALLREGYEQLSREIHDDLFLDDPERNLASSLNEIVSHALETEGWSPLLFELALIEDSRFIQSTPRFMSIVSCDKENARQVLDLYSHAMDFMNTAGAHSAPIVPALKTYQVPYVYIPSRTDAAPTSGKQAKAVFSTLLRMYEYSPQRGDEDPCDQVQTLWNQFSARINEGHLMDLGGAEFIAVPFIRPQYSPASLQRLKQGTPGGVFFCVMRKNVGAIHYRHLAMKISGLLHRSAAQYAISSTEANDRQTALLEQVGHELKSIVTELNWQETLSHVIDDKHISEKLRRELTLLISRMWMPHAIGTAMRSSRGLTEEAVVSFDRWIPKDGPTPDYSKLLPEYTASVVYLAKFLSNAYSSTPNNIYLGTPTGDSVQVVPDCFELRPHLLRFPPLKVQEELEFQPTLYAAAVVAEPIRNALKHSYSPNGEPSSVFLDLRVKDGNDGIVISIWNKRKPNEKFFVPTGNVIVKTLSNSINLGDLQWKADEQGWWKVDVTLHPHALRRGEIG